MYGFSDQPNGIPVTRFRADRQGSSRYSATMRQNRTPVRFCRASAGGGDDPSLGVERRLAATERLELGARDLVAGVIARADERRGLDVPEPEGERLALHVGELVGVVVALER